MVKSVDAVREPSPWARYLRQVQERPGWNIAKLSKALAETDTPIGTVALFKMLADNYKKLEVNQVIAIAKVLGDDPEMALRAAGDLLRPEHTDPRLWRLGLRADDPIVQQILDGPFDEAMKNELLEQLSIRRTKQLELQRALEAAEIAQAERLWKRGKRQA